MASFCLFSFFSQCKDKYSKNLTINYIIMDGMLGRGLLSSLKMNY